MYLSLQCVFYTTKLHLFPNSNYGGFIPVILLCLIAHIYLMVLIFSDVHFIPKLYPFLPIFNLYSLLLFIVVFCLM